MKGFRWRSWLQGVGHTEENLRCVFDSAERSGVILFFEESDALFGSRTEVRDGHDR